MNRSLLKLVPILIILGIIGIIYWVINLYNPWMLRSRPPIPTEAQNIVSKVDTENSYLNPRDLEITFTTSQSEEQVRTFYRTELAKRGWQEHNPEGDCTRALYSQFDWFGSFHKGGWWLSVDYTGNRVRLRESEGSRNVEDIIHTPIQYNWQSIATNNEQQFMLCFDPDGSAILIDSVRNILTGPYQEQGDTLTIELKTQTSPYTGSVDTTFCEKLPQIFHEYCAPQIIDHSDPSAYPGNVPIQGRPGYPAPSDPVLTTQQIKGTYQFSINQDQLTLTSASGVSQSFTIDRLP